jgi:hypothetical protein
METVFTMLLPVLCRDLVELREAALEPGVVHENVEPAELRGCLLDELLGERLIEQIARDEDCLPARLLDRLLHFLCVLCFPRQERDRNIGTLAREREGYGASDAGVPSRDKRRLAGEPA